MGMDRHRGISRGKVLTRGLLEIKRLDNADNRARGGLKGKVMQSANDLVSTGGINIKGLADLRSSKVDHILISERVVLSLAIEPTEEGFQEYTEKQKSILVELTPL